MAQEKKALQSKFVQDLLAAGDNSSDAPAGETAAAAAARNATASASAASAVAALAFSSKQHQLQRESAARSPENLATAANQQNEQSGQDSSGAGSPLSPLSQLTGSMVKLSALKAAQQETAVTVRWQRDPGGSFCFLGNG